MEANKIQWSYSGLKDYINCPRQYSEVKVLKRFQKAPTQQMLYGTEVHKALEDYVGEGKPLAKNYERYQKQLDPLRDMDGEKYPEYRMAVTYEKTPCKFGAKEYWVRGIVDLLVVDGEKAYIVDYKTGSNKYPDPKQLQLMSLLTFSHFPEVQFIKAGLLFVVHEHFVTSEYRREDQENLWADFASPLERLRLSHEQDSWQPNPSPLCGWCPVNTCEFHKER